MKSYITRVESALNDLRQGKIIILMDNPNRENEGDFIFPAEKINTEVMNFIIRNSSGIVCLSLLEAQLKQLELPFMVSPYENTSLRGTPFTISIDAKHHITTGVSAADRVKTILAAINVDAKPTDLLKPGHLFPLCAKKGGVLERAGHTEGAVDIVRLAGFMPAAVLCEIMNPDGTMARGDQLKKFAKKHKLFMLSIEDIIEYRVYKENLIAEQVSATLPLQTYGVFKITVIQEKFNGHEHIILEKDYTPSNPVLVRIHSCCVTGDLFGSMRCDCHQQLDYSLQRISNEGGILIYLNQEGRGIGLLNKIKAYALQEKGCDTIEANLQLGLPIDARKYHIAANILRNREITHVRLLTNNPAKINDLLRYGITEAMMESMPVFFNEINHDYLKAKKHKLNHSMDHDF